ncbi:DNA repair and recombination protein RadA [Thermoproteota archaeon]
MMAEAIVQEEMIIDQSTEKTDEVVGEKSKKKMKEEPEAPIEKEEKELTVLDIPGVGAATAEKLKESGFDSVMAIAVASPGTLVDASGVSEAVARKMINYSRDNMQMGFKSGEEMLAKRAKVIKISSGSDEFNKLLGGGFETGAIVECFGEFGSGKSQIAHILAVNCQLNDPTATAVFIDTENTFRPERIKELAKGVDLDENKVLKNIKIARAYNSDHQMLLAEKVSDIINKEKSNVKVVIIDSLTAHFRAEFLGRGTLAERQQKLNKHMHTLSKIADMNNVCVYVTNQVQVDPAQFFGDPTKAVGGHIVAHASTFRIYLRKGKKGSRVAKLIDAPNLPDGESAFMVTGEGLQDI